MRLFVDCTDTYFTGINTGIQRVVRKVALNSVSLSKSLEIETQAVVLKDGQFYPIDAAHDLTRPTNIPLRERLNTIYGRWTHAIASLLPGRMLKQLVLADRREFGLARLIWLPISLYQQLTRPKYAVASIEDGLNDSFQTGDVLLLIDASWSSRSFESITALKAKGVHVAIFIHDILPLTHPQFFVPRHNAIFLDWIKLALPIADSLLYNSVSTQKAVKQWVADSKTAHTLPGGAVIPLGNDIVSSLNSSFHHAGVRAIFSKDSPTFLCVGTLEPRKNQNRVIDAFEQLWASGEVCNLLIIGREGWLCHEIRRRITQHPAYKKQLFWHDDVNDADLGLAYAKANGAIIASAAEGFGLPLVEALSRGLPCLASDIPVFREIASDQAIFFDAGTPSSLADGVRAILGDPERRYSQTAFDWPSWSESTKQLIEHLKKLSSSSC